MGKSLDDLVERLESPAPVAVYQRGVLCEPLNSISDMRQTAHENAPPRPGKRSWRYSTTSLTDVPGNDTQATPWLLRAGMSSSGTTPPAMSRMSLPPSLSRS